MITVMSEVRSLLLTDVVDSTKLAEALGDRAMAEVWAAHDRVARDLLPVWRGREIDKTDGMLLLFDAAVDAVGYALAYHRALATLPVPLAARAGLHVGPVMLRENSAEDVVRGAKPLEVDGLAKPVVARVMSLARGGQTLLTPDAGQALGETALKLQSHGYWVMKGLSEPMELFEIGDDSAPFVALPDSEKVYRVVHSGKHWIPVREVPNNLPQQPTSFVGREKELAEIRSLLVRTRLFTLTGAGGCGKTRLALQVAVDALACHPDGVWMLELASLRDPAFVSQTVAVALGLTEEPGRSLTLTVAEHLKTKSPMLVLDNAEHVLQACAQLADTLLRQCPRVTLVVTSRERLGVAGELTYRVPSLTAPDPRRDKTPETVGPYESVRLFVERAQFQRPGFAVTTSNAAALASICHQLDGIPLALELAAARLNALSVEEICRRLDRRFRLLTGGSRTALPRQQTLRALIDWSYELLGMAERTLLVRLSVFVGGWTLAAAEGVCTGQDVDEGEVLELLSSLVDKSLVVAEERAGATRYRLLETVRQYAGDRLLEVGDAALWQERHLDYFLRLAEDSETQLTGGDQRAWLDRFEIEHENLRAALAWSAANDATASSGLRLAGALTRFWYMRGHFGEGRTWLGSFLAKTSRDKDTAARAKALRGTAKLALQQGDLASAWQFDEQCLAIYRALGDRRGVAATLNEMGVVAAQQGDDGAARKLLEESLAIHWELDDRHGVALTLNGLANLACAQGDYAVAQSLHERGLAINRSLGDRRSVAISLVNLGAVAEARGDRLAARALYQECLEIFRELNEKVGIASSLINLGVVAVALGEIPHAQGLYQESLAMLRELGDRRGIAFSLEGLADVGLASGCAGRAACIWGAAERLREEISSPLAPFERGRYLTQLAAARGALGDADFATAWQKGRAVTLEQAINYAMSEDDATPPNSARRKACREP